MIRLPGHAGRVRGLASTPEGSTLVPCEDDGMIRFRDRATGRSFAEGRGCLADSGPMFACHDREIGRLGCLAFAPDGLTVAAGGGRGIVVCDVEF